MRCGKGFVCIAWSENRGLEHEQENVGLIRPDLRAGIENEKAEILKQAVDLYEGTQDVFSLSDFTNHSLKPEVGMICSS